MVRRAVACVAIVVGLGLIAIPPSYSLFARTADAERILNRFEFLTLDGHPARYLAEARTTRAGSTELVDKAIPSLASDAGMSGSAFIRLAAARFPALTAARIEVPRANRFSIRYSKQLAAVAGKFQSVYDIPISSLPLTATPWLLLVGGLGSLGAGLAALRTSRRAALVTILAIGSALALGPLALGAPKKAAAGEDVKVFASRGLTPRAARAAQAAFASLDALVRETDTRTLPYLASRQGHTERQLRGKLDRDFQATAKFLSQWGAIGPRLSRLADAVSKSVHDFESAKKMPISFPVFVLLGAGLAMSLSAGLALLLEARRPLPN